MLKPPASGPMGAQALTNHQRRVHIVILISRPSIVTASSISSPHFSLLNLYHMHSCHGSRTRHVLCCGIGSNIGPDHDLCGYAGVGGGMCRHPAPMRSTDHLNFTRPITVLHLAMTLPPHIHNDKSSVSHSRSQGPMYVGAFLGILHY